MQGYDLVMIGVMAFAIFRGYSKGLAWQISSIASIAASYFVAYRFKDTVTPMIDMPDPWRGLIAMMALFIGTSLVIWLLFQSIRGAIEKAKLKEFDQQLGAIFGGVKGAAWCTVITLVALSFMSQDMSQQIVNSQSGGYIARLLASSKRIVPAEVQQVVQPYIQHAEDKLQNRSDDVTPIVGEQPNGQTGFPPQSPQGQQPVQPYWYNEANSNNNDPLKEFSTTNDRWK